MRRSFWDQAFSSDGEMGFRATAYGAMGARCDEEKAKRMCAWMGVWREANAKV